ncbi:unnamed protein product [Didymodactylos carnosus]|uniref:Uncharacterized protein n=1 Tax=Didymodactylos carnosus TaxID=1234261 RepID=A0A815DPX9_9BILA|nr:unnamed protein product [Didymodactylos carnosus]CAF4121652.1 unnamed protein product [Didymodactylos carnosus]
MAEDENSNLSLSSFQTLFTNKINIISDKMFVTFLQDLVFIYLTIDGIYAKKVLIDNDDEAREKGLSECIVIYDKAINLHLKIIMYQDKNLLIYEKLGNVHELNKNLENAIKNYENALEEINIFDNTLEDVKTNKYALTYKLFNFDYRLASSSDMSRFEHNDSISSMKIIDGA